jgi:hypothetical protein
MHNLSDLFFYLYFVDLHTLELVIGEARRILAERQRYPEFEGTGVGASEHTLPGARP